MKLIIATSNVHKAREVAAMVGSAFQVLTLKDIGFDRKIIEDGKTFEENAKIKLKHLIDFLRSSGFQEDAVLLADDSGLEVDALKGAPGVFSARFAGPSANDAANTAKLLDAMKGISGAKRTARFQCVLATTYIKSGRDSGIQIFVGSCEGKIGFKLKGKEGFGYDPVFFPEGFCRTFAELSSEEKNRMSHRARAMQKFKDWVKGVSL